MAETKLSLAVPFNTSVIAAVKRRTSVRTYKLIRISQHHKCVIKKGMDALSNEDHRFVWFERDSEDDLMERIGTYGVIKGARAFLVGIIRKDSVHHKYSAIHFGYDFEQIILKATELDLGTCWIAGTYIPPMFASHIDARWNERIVMISPIGVPAGKRHLIAQLATRSAKSISRRPWEKLFFDGSVHSPLSKKKAGKYAMALEMVRLSPSAVNSQPWRVIRDVRGFHFYAAETRYISLGKGEFLRRNDIGISMAHFELACRELGIEGKWIIDAQSSGRETNLEYIYTWRAKE